jgi:hypothetical protein
LKLLTSNLQYSNSPEVHQSIASIIQKISNSLAEKTKDVILIHDNQPFEKRINSTFSTGSELPNNFMMTFDLSTKLLNSQQHNSPELAQQLRQCLEMTNIGLNQNEALIQSLHDRIEELQTDRNDPQIISNLKMISTELNSIQTGDYIGNQILKSPSESVPIITSILHKSKQSNAIRSIGASDLIQTLAGQVSNHEIDFGTFTPLFNEVIN